MINRQIPEKGLKVYEKLYGRLLTPDNAAEIKFNLIGYIRTLIEMDKQYKEQEHITNLYISDNK